MAQKLTLTEYLRGRGAIKALTKIEADAFKIPWPLQSGWPAKFGAMEITREMLADLAKRVASARQSTARKALCGLDAANGSPSRPTLAPPAVRVNVEPSTKLAGTVLPPPVNSPSFPGFALRQARRYRSRSSAPWA